jgi:hypothetical protein
MRYSRDFFALQLDLARRVSAVAGISLAEAVFAYTNCHVRFGFGRTFDAAHPGWLEYVAGLREASDPDDWTYRFYLARPAEAGAPAVVATVGCFAYAWLDETRIRLHFHDREPGGGSPLAIERQEQRRAELAALFAHVKRAGAGGSTPRVVGASWLYNLEAYRRLFPPAYLATARVLPGRFRHMPRWGQFVDRRGEVKEKPAAELRARVTRLSRVDDLDACFPLPVLGLEAPACDFYRFFGEG